MRWNAGGAGRVKAVTAVVIAAVLAAGLAALGFNAVGGFNGPAPGRAFLPQFHDRARGLPGDVLA